MSSYDPAALECLAAIVEEGGFERAAQRLNVTQSAVSQRLRALEALVGSVLIVRSRPLRPTSAGHLLLKHTKQLRLLRADLERDLQELAPSAPGSGREDERISIAINADSIATWALDAVHDLVRQRLPLESKLVREAHRLPTVVVTVQNPNKRLTDAGVTVLRVAESDGRPEPGAVLEALLGYWRERLAERFPGVAPGGVEMNLMIEGGGQVAASFLSAGLVDQIEWFRAPIVLGDEGRPAIGAFVLKDLAAMDFEFIVCDSPAGIETGALMAMHFADEALVVTNPEVSSVRDSDRILGMLSSKTQRAIEAPSPSRNTCSSPATTRTGWTRGRC